MAVVANFWVVQYLAPTGAIRTFLHFEFFSGKSRSSKSISIVAPNEFWGQGPVLRTTAVPGKEGGSEKKNAETLMCVTYGEQGVVGEHQQ